MTNELTTAVMAAPRLDFPFWEDERSTVRRAVDGEYTRNAEGDLVFHEVRWRRSWLYTLGMPNNHVPFTLLGRLSLGAWRAVAQPELRFASERATQMALEAIQALGGNGYINDYPAGRLLRDAKLYEIGAGTSEIRRMLIGREMFQETA